MSGFSRIDTRPLVDMLTTAGSTVSTMGAKLGKGAPSTIAGRPACARTAPSGKTTTNKKILTQYELSIS